MRMKLLIVVSVLLVAILAIGCGEDHPTSVEMDSIMIQVRHVYQDMNEKPVPDKYYTFKLEEGNEFVSIPGAEEVKMFKLIDAIDPLHAEIQFESLYLSSFNVFSDSFTVIVGLEEVFFTPSVSIPELSEYYCVRVSFGGY